MIRYTQKNYYFVLSFEKECNGKYEHLLLFLGYYLI